MFAERLTVPLTTNASGACEAYSDPIQAGRVLAVRYVKTNFDNSVDFTITAEKTGESILALTDQTTAGVWYPRAQVHGITGTGLTLDGTRLLVEPILLVNDRVKVVIAQGGNAKTGSIELLIG